MTFPSECTLQAKDLSEEKQQEEPSSGWGSWDLGKWANRPPSRRPRVALPSHWEPAAASTDSATQLQLWAAVMGPPICPSKMPLCILSRTILSPSWADKCPWLAANKQDRRTDGPGTAPQKPGLDSVIHTEFGTQRPTCPGNL